MNWLAHLHLSTDSPAARIGNLLPDILKAPELDALPDCFHEGIAQHRWVDRFTDAHPVFRKSSRRVDGDLRRFGPILVDLFYDHFLCLSWHRHSQVPLGKFVAGFHASIDDFRQELPEKAYARLARIRDEGWLLSYQHPDDLWTVLERLGKRFRRPVDLTRGVAILSQCREQFAADFSEFYPELVLNAAADPRL